MSYRLTIRRGSKVTRESYEELPDALAALRSQAESVIADGGLPEVNLIRRFEPAQRVAARLEIATGGWTGDAAGVDVMGDGRIVPFRGAVFRRELEPAEGEEPYEVLRRELT
jgi:hypothetical protein